MINFEPNTTETCKIETCESDFDMCEPEFETVEKSLTEEFIEGRHFVCAIDEVNHEHFRGFPVEIDLEGPPNDDDEDSGYVPTPEHERDEAMPSDLGERKEVIPKEFESDFQKSSKSPSCWVAFCGNTKLVATGLMTKPVTLVYRLVVGLLQGDVDIRVVMRAVQPFRH